MRILLVAAAAICLAAPSASEAVLIMVPDNYSTLGEALAAASIGDDILVRPGTYTERVNLVEGVALRSMSGPEVTIIDGSDGGRTVDAEGVTAELRGFTVTGGFGPSNGGGMRVWNAADVQIVDCIFDGNDAVGQGGGLGIQDSFAEVSTCTFINNTSSSGAALYVEGAAPGDVSVMYCDMYSNLAAGHGGAMFVANGSVSLDNCRIYNNSCSSLGGAIALDFASIDATDNEIFSNIANEGGGISFHNSSGGTISTTTFYKNSANLGGAVSCTNNSSPTIQQSILASSFLGAAMTCAVGSNPTVTCSNLYGNAAGDGICGVDGGNNLFEDPQFCRESPEVDEVFSLQSDSMCAAANSPCGLRIGSGDVECGVSAITSSTWGRMKVFYQN